MGKGLKITFGIIGGLVGVLALGVAAFYGCFYEDSTSPVTKDPNFNVENVVDNLMYESIASTSESKKLTFNLNKDDINQILLNLSESANGQFKDYIEAPYISFNEQKESLNISVGAHVPLFSTKVTFVSYLSMYEETSKDASIYFNIQNIEVGRVDLYGPVMNIIEKNNIDSTLNEYFASAGFNLKFDLTNRQITYSVKDMLNDVMAIGGGNNEFNSIGSILLSVPNYELEVTNEKIGINLKLDGTNSNDYQDYSLSNSISMKTYQIQRNCEILLDRGFIDAEKINNAMEYLIKGYDFSSPATKEYVRDLNLRAIGIEDNIAYTGVYETTPLTFDEILLKASEDVVLSPDAFTFSISDKMISEAVLGANLIGESFSFVQKEQDHHHVASIIVDDAYVNIAQSKEGEDFLFIQLGLNINGYSTIFNIACKADPTVSDKFVFKINEFNYGIHELDIANDSIMSFVEHCFSNGEFMEFDAINQTFTIDIKNILTNSDNKLGSLMNVRDYQLNLNSGTDALEILFK